jgi:hypothetical protein
VSLAATCAWALLVAAQLGWLPGTRFAWAFGLWRYFPPGVSAVLAAVSLLLCHRAPRAAILRLVEQAASAAARLPRTVRATLLLVGISLGLWALRERQLSGDSPLLLLAVQGGDQFVFPDTGATWLLMQVCTLAKSVSIPVWPAAQLWSCAWGGVTAALLAGMAKRLAPGNGPAAAVLILSGGLLRVFAGHVETYPVLLAAVVAYLWAGLSRLGDRGSLALPCLALGIALWVHAAAACLIPSLVWLLWDTAESSPAAHRLRRTSLGLALAALPTLLFFLTAMLTTDGRASLVDALAKALEILGQSNDPTATRWWVRGFGGEPSIGTDVVLLSRAQLKYLLNAAHLLSPFALPGIAMVVATNPRSLVAAASARFLMLVSAPLVLYAFALRPFWGPYDWDLFAPTALALSVLVLHVLATRREARSFRAMAVVLIGFAWLFVTLPFLATGVLTMRQAGPFAVPLQEYELRKALQPAPDWLAPWL